MKPDAENNQAPNSTSVCHDDVAAIMRSIMQFDVGIYRLKMAIHTHVKDEAERVAFARVLHGIIEYQDAMLQKAERLMDGLEHNKLLKLDALRSLSDELEVTLKKTQDEAAEASDALNDALAKSMAESLTKPGSTLSALATVLLGSDIAQQLVKDLKKPDAEPKADATKPNA